MSWRHLVIISLLLFTGCNSIRTTALDQSESGHFSRNPNIPLKGVPVMVRVPTHLDVHILQVDYWAADKDGLTMISGEFPSRHVETRIAYTEQMFLVDPKRPASGIGIYGFDFSSKKEGDKDGEYPGHGYLSGVTYKAVDKTLEDSAALIGSLSNVLGAATATGDKDAIKKAGVLTTTRTVAFRRFNISAPGVDEEVRCFVRAFLNGCHACEQVGPQYPQ